jgi:OOP family OmpA-OmpF porin
MHQFISFHLESIQMKKLLVVAALASTFMATSAFAQGYIGFGLGSANVRGTNSTVGAVSVTGGDSSKGSAKIYGGFQFTPNWGLEAQYSDLGSRNYTVTNAGVVTTGSARSSQYSLAGTGTLPMGNSFALIGKLGVSANRAGYPGSNNKTSVMAGVGVSYSITPRLAVRLEYEDFGKFSDNNGFGGGSIRATNTSLNLQYAF